MQAFIGKSMKSQKKGEVDFCLDFLINEDMGFDFNPYGEREIQVIQPSYDVGNVTCRELDKVVNLSLEPLS